MATYGVHTLPIFARFALAFTMRLVRLLRVGLLGLGVLASAICRKKSGVLPSRLGSRVGLSLGAEVWTSPATRGGLFTISAFLRVVRLGTL